MTRPASSTWFRRNAFPLTVGVLLVVFIGLIAYLFVDELFAPKVWVEVDAGTDTESKFVYRRDATNTRQLHNDMVGLVESYGGEPFSFEIELGSAGRRTMSVIVSTYRVEYTLSEVIITDLHMGGGETQIYNETGEGDTELMQILPSVLTELVSDFRQTVQWHFLQGRGDTEQSWFLF